MYTDDELLTAGFEILEQKLGAVDAERFIAIILGNSGDYTLERRDAFDHMSLEEINRETAAYCREHPISDEARRRSDRYKAEHGIE